MAYEISGDDFTRISPTCNEKSVDKLCLEIHVDSDQNALDGKAFTVVNDNLATLYGVRAGAKSLRVQIYKYVLDEAEPHKPTRDLASTIEWDLTLPKIQEESSASVVGSPAFLYMGDSQTVSFSSPTFSAFSTVTSPISVTFDARTMIGTYDPKKKTLNVQITTDITKIPGHKEMTVTVPAQNGGTAQLTTLTFDVVRIIKQ